jgi:hypothetical protein
MGILDSIRNGMRTWLGVHDDGYDEFQERQEKTALERDYRLGFQRRMLKTKYGQPDDNIFVNFVGLIVDRSVSGLFGEGITFELPGGNIETKVKGKTVIKQSAEQMWIDKVWDLNRQEILLHKSALLASESGTGYIKIQPEGITDKDGKVYPRLIPLDPLYMTMETTPHDCDTVIRYIIRYNYMRGKDEIAFKEVTELNDKGKWEVITYEDAGSGYVELSREVWGWSFAPIIHWQNLPAAGSPYGQADITDDVIMLQDRLNFIASNISKIIRYHAHPKTFTINAGAPKTESWGSDQMIQFSGDANTSIANLEMQSDLASSEAFFTSMRQALFDITRTVDIDSIADKLGALTNFGLKVLYQDSLAKIHTKRELYGDALIELNSRLLEMNGMNNDAGEILWPDVMPVNGLEQSDELQADIAMGILDQQTACNIKGYDWELVQERMAENGQNNMSIGEAILTQFQRGQE